MNNITLICCVVSATVLTACSESTSTQREYAGFRDECREYAELKSSYGIERPTSSNHEKKMLLNSFRDCMSKKGWSVTAPGQDTPDTPPVEGSPDGDVNIMTAAPVPIAPVQSANERYTKRAAECAYARHASSHSSNARALAKACEIECQNEKALAPEMPIPAACAE